MAVAVFTGLHSISTASLCYFSSKRVPYRGFFRGLKWSRNLSNCGSTKRSLRVGLWSGRVESLKEDGKTDSDNSIDEPEFIHLIAIGSRRDAVVDFCLDSPFELSSSLQFWNVHVKDLPSVQLQERTLQKDLDPRVVGASQFLQSCPRAMILVATAGYGSDHVAAINILETVKSRNGFAAAIIVKPFSFEGQKRQDEVKDLLEKLQEHTNFYIDIDTDALLKKDLVTLDEAMKTANTAVLLAINAISVLISETHHKVIDADNNVKELLLSEVLKILQHHKEAKIGFGAASSVKNSVLRALHDCPFIGDGLESLNGFSGIAVCVIASSGSMDSRDISDSLHIFRQTTEYTGDILMSTLQETNMEPHVVVTALVLIGSVELSTPQKSSILSRLAQHFPFIFNFFNREQQPNGTERNNALKDHSASESRIAVEGVACEPVPDVNTLSDGNKTDNYGTFNRSEEGEVGLTDSMNEPSDIFDQINEGTTAFQRVPLNNWNVGPGYKIAQEWAKERASSIPMLENLSIFRLPVGVRHPEESKKSMNLSYAAERAELETGDIVKEQTLANSSVPSWDLVTDTGFVAMRDLYNNASALLKGRNADVPKKQGILAVRAASMLEAERESPKKWSPIIEMQYRGGFYRGRCQGGLPEGKGRLIHGDGSIYEGMWRYGKRSGQGAFYFTNSDVFQGSWREGTMHGKGWFYFHTGDRWFANFWKGKANGESRFYSVSGDVFFGHFQDGYRHGEFLCIGVDGTRCVEMWDDGVLLSRKQLDSNTDSV